MSAYVRIWPLFRRISAPRACPGRARRRSPPPQIRYRRASVGRETSGFFRHLPVFRNISPSAPPEGLPAEEATLSAWLRRKRGTVAGEQGGACIEDRINAQAQ